MKLVTTHDHARYIAWHDRALSDRHAATQLAVGGWTSVRPEVADGWSLARYLSDDDSTLLWLSFDRTTRTEASIGLVCLHWERCRRAVCAGRALHELPGILRWHGVAVAKSVVLASNAESLRLHNRRIGAPWGVEPLGGWDAALGCWVDLHHFRRVLLP